MFAEWCQRLQTVVGDPQKSFKVFLSLSLQTRVIVLREDDGRGNVLHWTNEVEAGMREHFLPAVDCADL